MKELQSKKLKVLYYVDIFGKVPFIVNQIEQIAGHAQVQVVCLQNFYSGSIIKVHEINFNQAFTKIRHFLEIHDWYYGFKDKKFQTELNAIISDFNPDLMHIQFGYDALKVFDNSFNESLKYLIHFRGYDASNKLFSKKYINKLKGILKKRNVYPLFVCEHLKNNLESKDISIDEHLILHSNTNTDFYNRKQSPPPVSSKFRFLQVSSFRKKKGHEYTLKAIAKFLALTDKPERFEFIFTGADENNNLYQEIKTLAHELGIQNNLLFHGWIDKNETKKLLESSHVIMQHSITTPDGDEEGIPNALMEGMAMELPVLSTKHAGIPELVRKHEFAYLVHEKDTIGYAIAMNEIVKNWRLAPENRTRIEQSFSINQFESTLLNFYQKILE